MRKLIYFIFNNQIMINFFTINCNFYCICYILLRLCHICPVIAYGQAYIKKNPIANFVTCYRIL
jgi:hypothetical protein